MGPLRLRDKNETTWNPLKFWQVSGFGGRESDRYGPVKVGRRIGRLSEDLIRGANLVALTRAGYSPQVAADLVTKFQFDYCVDEETQALTSSGWRSVDDIKVGDLILSINPETMQSEWVDVIEMNVFDYEGDMSHWQSQTFDAMTTPRHKWIAEGSGVRGGHYTKKKGSFHFITTEELNNKKYKVLTVGGGSPPEPISEDEYEDQFVELVGWYITEGSNTATPKGITVAQSLSHNPEYVARIRSISQYYSELGFTSTEYEPRDNGWGPIVAFYFGEGIGDRVRSVCPGKQLTPEFLVSLSGRQLQILFDTILDADGRGSDAESWLLTQKDIGRSDSFQMLCSMLGFRSNLRLMASTGCHNVTAYRRGSRLHNDALHKSTVPYKGRVWCPTTKYGTWMARRSGFTYWTGNSRLSEFEKNVMKRLIPFYSYSRFNLPLQVDQLFNNPKLMSAQLRAFNTFRDREYTPSYVGEGASFKIGKPVQGNQLYLTQLGLPIEEALGRLKMGDYFPDVWETLSRNVAMSTPLIKYPLEAITGKQLSTGRQLSDLKPGGLGSLYGNLDEVYSQPITQLLANSPFARFATTIDKISDTRKSIPTRLANVLTGVKFTTVDLERARAIDTRRALEALLKAAPKVAEFGEFYVPPEQRAGLSPDLVELLRLFATMKQRARKAAAERRFMEGLSR